MRYDKKMIRAAIKDKIDRDNAWNLYGKAPSTSWNARIPEHHFYFRNHKLELRVYDARGEVTDEHGNVIVSYIRKWSSKKVCLTYKELMPKLEWAV